MTRTTHDCVQERCNTDTRTAVEVEAEGHAAALRGATYENVPYGHTHADVRFNAWERGRWKALGEWCYAHNQCAGFCAGFPEVDIAPEVGPCHLTT